LFEQLRDGREQLQALSQRLMEAQEAERRYIAQELHDEIGQALTAVKINLQSIQHLSGGLSAPDAPNQEHSTQPTVADTPASNSSALASRLEESIGIVDRTLQQVRNLSLDLRPSLLDDLGLASALRWYVDRQALRTNLDIRFDADPLESRPALMIETACFRVAQEALTNVVRHAQAHHAEVELRSSGMELQLIVRDDGNGFDVQTARRNAVHGTSLGLLSMQERVSLVSGRIEIQSKMGEGTEVRACFPLTAS
jgi:signal transduction histidine kinase